MQPSSMLTATWLYLCTGDQALLKRIHPEKVKGGVAAADTRAKYSD